MQRQIFLFRQWLCIGFFAVTTFSAFADDVPLVKRLWFEVHTEHFRIYSCGVPAQVYKVASRLEQFCSTYSALAGASAVASPPIVVMVYPDHESMKPFLPIYQGQPANLAAFFQHGSDENLIVLALPGDSDAEMDMSVVFHEYTHLLLRRNDQVWPLWLKEGMAEIYSTFQMYGYYAYIARPIDHHLSLLANEPMMPLSELFSVTHDSPQYNESSRQGIFYAESWLLTDYLIAGDSQVYRARFNNYTTLLREGQTPVQAFTNALGAGLPQIEASLRAYLARNQFTPIQLNLPGAIGLSAAPAVRRLTPVENYFRLGDQLLRIGRFDTAAQFFNDGKQLAPASPLPYEGLGLLALYQQNADEALSQFTKSLAHNSTSFLTHYYYAWLKFQVAGETGLLSPEAGKEIHDELFKSIALMPNFGTSHELLGLLSMSQPEMHWLGEQQLQIAVRLEPENASFQLALAQAQFENKEPDDARRTLTALLLPTTPPKLRVQATDLMQKIISN